ncbi:MAG: hypothetical protein ACRBCT_01185 [Alphaproteobacteria bacterium]
MRQFLIFGVCAFAVGFPVFGPVWAQETITVIRADGTRVEMALPDSLEGLVEVTPEEAAPAPVLVPEAVKEVPEEKAKPKEKPKPPKQVKKKVRDWLALVPPRKPAVPKWFTLREAGLAITAEQALDLAIDVAPPSRDVDMEMRGGDYAVVFKTEDGRYEIVISRENGAVLSKGYVE